ncbi:MAG: glycosyltransferase family 4 protein [Dehalococcoidales bacterium]|nr:glycosyltransferase family 4 protein [Dehalococcoidales bacterium]
MRIFFGITGQLGYGGLVQQSVMLVKYLREFGCEVFPLVGLAPPHNDEVDLDELDYTFEAFNLADYVLREKSPVWRWLLGWYARLQVAKTNPQKLKKPGLNGQHKVDVKKVLHNLIYNPEESDIEKVNKLRREFNPDIDYACELSMASYFGLLDDLGVPLVTSAQGYELCQRYGVDLVPVIRANANRIDALISGSYANVKENVAQDLPFLLPKTHVVHYGIINDEHYDMSLEEARTRARRFCRESDDFTVISLGRMDIEKGVDLALHSVRLLLNEGVRVRLRIVGDWPINEHYYPVMQAKIGMMDLQEHVDCIGFVESKADKVALLKTSDAMLATFIKSEPFGLVLAEAMAAGIPVISPDTGAGSEILRWNGYRSGLIYRTQDTGQIADAIRYLAEHPEECREMGQSGIAAVTEHFNARRMAYDIMKIFEELLDTRKAEKRSTYLMSSV